MHLAFCTLISGPPQSVRHLLPHKFWVEEEFPLTTDWLKEESKKMVLLRAGEGHAQLESRVPSSDRGTRLAQPLETPEPLPIQPSLGASLGLDWLLTDSRVLIGARAGGGGLGAWKTASPGAGIRA